MKGFGKEYWSPVVPKLFGPICQSLTFVADNGWTIMSSICSQIRKKKRQTRAPSLSWEVQRQEGSRRQVIGNRSTDRQVQHCAQSVSNSILPRLHTRWVYCSDEMNSCSHIHAIEASVWFYMWTQFNTGVLQRSSFAVNTATQTEPSCGDTARISSVISTKLQKAYTHIIGA